MAADDDAPAVVEKARPHRSTCPRCGERTLVVTVRGETLVAEPYEHSPGDGKFPELGVVVREDGTAVRWRARWAGGKGRYAGEAVHPFHRCRDLT